MIQETAWTRLLHPEHQSFHRKTMESSGSRLPATLRWGLLALPLLILLAACTSVDIGGETVTSVPASAAADDVTAEVALPPDVEALKAVFNQDAGRTRLLLLMSPT